MLNPLLRCQFGQDINVEMISAIPSVKSNTVAYVFKVLIDPFIGKISIFAFIKVKLIKIVIYRT
jgi:translation elongation factor EF-G